MQAKCFVFAIQSDSSDLFSRKKSAFPERKLSLYSTVWVNFSKLLMKPTKCHRFHHLNLIFEIGFTKAKNELFSHCYKDLVEHLNRPIWLSFRFEMNKTCVFSIKKFEHYGDQFILTEVVNSGYRGIKHLYKNRFFVAYKCDIFESNYNVKGIHP